MSCFYFNFFIYYDKFLFDWLWHTFAVFLFREAASPLSSWTSLTFRRTAINPFACFASTFFCAVFPSAFLITFVNFVCLFYFRIIIVLAVIRMIFIFLATFTALSMIFFSMFEIIAIESYASILMLFFD